MPRNMPSTDSISRFAIRCYDPRLLVQTAVPPPTMDAGRCHRSLVGSIRVFDCASTTRAQCGGSHGCGLCGDFSSNMLLSGAGAGEALGAFPSGWQICPDSGLQREYTHRRRARVTSLCHASFKNCVHNHAVCAVRGYLGQHDDEVFRDAHGYRSSHMGWTFAKRPVPARNHVCVRQFCSKCTSMYGMLLR